MEQRLTIITLGVNDLNVSTEFYEKIFGWEKMSSSTETITFFQLNGMLLSLYSKDKLAEDVSIPQDGIGFRRFTIAYNTRSEQEVDQLIRDFEAKGVKIVKQPEKAFWGGYSSYIADPDDNLWEIAFNPFLKMDEKGSPIKE